MEFYRRLSEILERDGAAVLATVVETKGSTPRETGAKMIVRRSGEIFGTIGGGAGEAKVIEAVKNVFELGEKQFVEIDLTDFRAEGICGGKMKVWLERWQGKESLALINQVLQAIENGQNVNLITPLTEKDLPHLLPCNESVFENAFVEKIEPPPFLLIVGAGHVGIELAKIASSIGFEIAVQDDRIEWANRRNYPFAREILTEPIEKAYLVSLANRRQLYIALLTRGFERDLEALKALLECDLTFRYIGMIGSEKRTQQVFREMEKQGIAKKALEQIKAPIGLEINALTPAEIAVSIAAELISVRRK
jgi:xanthine dehydrogenase accessory factor